jgi:hypothetical protein
VARKLLAKGASVPRELVAQPDADLKALAA